MPRQDGFRQTGARIDRLRVDRIQMFMPPKDPEGDRTWLYLGLIAVPSRPLGTEEIKLMLVPPWRKDRTTGG
jgi:hypothetical protein